MSRPPVTAWLKTALRVAVAATVLLIVLRLVHPADLAARLAGVDPPALAFGFAAAVVAYALGAERLAILARSQGIALRGWQALEVTLAGLFYGIFLPAGNATGLAVRLWRLAGDDRRFGPAMFALLVDRVVTTASLAVVGLTFWLLDMERAPMTAATVLAVTLAGTALVWTALASRTVARLLERFSGLPAIGRLLRASAESVRGLRRLHAREFAALPLLSVVAHLASIAAWFAIARAAGLEVDLLTVAWLRCAAVAVTLVPVTIAGLGLREGAVLVMLRPYGVEHDAALAFSLLISTVTVIGVGLLGGVLDGIRFLRARD